MDKYRESIVFYVYWKREETYYLIGRLVYDNSQLAPLKREAWARVRVSQSCRCLCGYPTRDRNKP